MPTTQSSQKRKSKVISVSLNEYQLDKARRLSEEGPFNSVSDVISIALTEFFTRDDLQKEVSESETCPNNVHELIKEYLSSPDGEALIRSIIRKSLAETKERAAATAVQEPEHKKPSWNVIHQ